MIELIKPGSGLLQEEIVYAQYPVCEIKRLYDYRLRYQLLREEMAKLVQENQQLKEKISQLKYYVA